MKKSCFFLMLLLLLPFKVYCSSILESIDFHQEGETSKLVLSFDSENVIAKHFHLNDDKQIILDITDIKAEEKITRPFDTSEFSGSVVYVSPYRRPNSKDDLRIALQLRDNVRSALERKGKKLILTIENRFGAFTKKKMEALKEDETAIALGKGNSQIHVPKSMDIVDILDNITVSGAKKYVGKKISLNVKGIDISSLLKMIGDSSGFNIILSDEVKKTPPLTLSFTNIPWDQALDTILTLGKLVATKNGNILIVRTYEEASNERKIEEVEKQLSIKKEPLMTRIFPISFASIEELQKLLKDYITKDRGSVSFDTRTNNLIVKDTMEAIERIAKIIETLDTQTPQILIEAKVVEASENFKKEIGLQDGIGFGYDPITPQADLGTNEGPGFSFSSAPSVGDGARSFLTFGIKTFKRMLNLDLKLQLMESESKVKIISSPKIVAQNKKKATLVSQDGTSYRVVSQNGDVREESFQQISADLNLEVTPTVTNEGSIAMAIKISKAGFGTRPSANAPPDKQTREINTDVLVDNGATIVIGGVFSFQKEESHSGVPFLKDLPIIGWLFRTAYNPSKTKSELIIFVTPRIINQEEAGFVEKKDNVG